MRSFRFEAVRTGAAATARYASSSPRDPDEGPTYLEFWDRLWSSGAAKTVAEPTFDDGSGNSWLNTAFYHTRSAAGLDEHTGVLLMLIGGLARLSTLYFSLYGERAAARMQRALPELKPAHEQFQRVYYNDQTSALQVQQAATVLKSIRRQTFKQHQTSNIRTLAGLCGSPILLQGMYGVSRVCSSPYSDVGMSSWAWIPALGGADPFFVLPAVCCGLTLLNFEWTLSSRLNTKQGTMANVILGARLLALGAIPAVAQFQSGVLLYWIGMSVVGLAQPLLVRMSAFRRWFGIPEVVQSEDELIQRRLVLQAPTLSYLFEGEQSLHPSQAPSSSPTVAADAAPSPFPSSALYNERQARTLSEEMQRVEASQFQKQQKSSQRAAVEGKGAAFARFGSQSSWRAKDPAPVEMMDDMLPDAFKSSNVKK